LSVGLLYSTLSMLMGAALVEHFDDERFFAVVPAAQITYSIAAERSGRR